ncbi:uncharacterized protein LOC113234882, partial [Hyposmocoma kahamanoa]|uniref:uncharacterized protein LOC113234882 n=1 Tax=Hyposmocoma kahamanoa TaxID=1477025 RepID=UPI000E6DA482
MQKCHDIRNLDTCDLFKQFHIVNNGCADSEQEDLYNMFFHYVKPKLDCPIKAGNYKITDYPFFTEDSDLTASESKISTSVFGYTYRLQGYDDDDKRLLCTDASLQLLYIREHD